MMLGRKVRAENADLTRREIARKLQIIQYFVEAQASLGFFNIVSIE